MFVCDKRLPAELFVPAEQPVWGHLSAPPVEEGWSLTHCRLSEESPLQDREGMSLLLHVFHIIYLVFDLLTWRASHLGSALFLFKAKSQTV